MLAAFVLVQALACRFVQPNAVEAFGDVVDKVVGFDVVRQPEKRFHLAQLGHGVVHKLIAIDHMDLVLREQFDPLVKEDCILTDAHPFVVGVDVTIGQKDHILERFRSHLLHCSIAGQLSVVRDETGDRVAHDEQQLERSIHGIDAFGHAVGGVVCGRLLDHNIRDTTEWHLLSIPFQALLILVVFIEEVQLIDHFLDVGMNVEEL